MTTDGTPPPTPADVVARLRPLLGADISKRRLRTWWSDRRIPAPVRVGPLAGQGPGSRRVWNEPAIAVRAAVMAASMRRFKDLDFAELDTWFLGFPLPPDTGGADPLERVRASWLRSERRRSNDALAQQLHRPTVSDTELDADHLRDAQRYLPKHLRGDGGLLRLRSVLDPAFTSMTDGQAAVLADSLATEGVEHPLLAALLSAAGAVDALFGAFREVASSVGVKRAVEETSPDDLEAAHRDVWYLAGVVRFLAEVGLEPEADGGLFWFAVHAGPKLGRLALVADVALRRAGHGPRVDATIAALAALAQRAETGAALEVWRRKLIGMVTVADDGVENAAEHGAADDDAAAAKAFDALVALLMEAGAAVAGIWGPVLRHSPLRSAWEAATAAITTGATPER